MPLHGVRVSADRPLRTRRAIKKNVVAASECTAVCIFYYVRALHTVDKECNWLRSHVCVFGRACISVGSIGIWGLSRHVLDILAEPRQWRGACLDGNFVNWTCATFILRLFFPLPIFTTTTTHLDPSDSPPARCPQPHRAFLPLCSPP